MKVWVIEDWDYEGCEVKGVFSTEEKAEKWIADNKGKAFGEFSANEYELDMPSEDDRREGL